MNKQEDTSTKTAESHQVEFLVRQKFEDMDKEQLVKLCYSAQDYLDYMMKINVTNMICDKWIIEKSLNETFWQKFVNDLQNNDKTPDKFLDIVAAHFKFPD